MRRLKCTSTVVVLWISVALMFFWLVIDIHWFFCLLVIHILFLFTMLQLTGAFDLLPMNYLVLQLFDFLPLKVQSAIRRARRSSPVDGSEAKAVVDLLQFAENLQITLKAAVKEDADWYKRFMPLTEVVNMTNEPCAFE